MMTVANRQKGKTSNEAALAAFVQHKADIDAMLARLQALSDEHFNRTPDSITWADAGSLEQVAVLLRRASDFAFAEGDNAA